VRDFDIDRATREDSDRQFRIGGEDFTFRAYVHPEDLVRIQNAVTDGDFLGVTDEIFPTSLLEAGQEKKWAKVRSRQNEKPLSVTDIVAVINYIATVATGRPTEQSSDSSATSSPTGTASKGNSRSKALTSVA
jgi:hypothetical protein